MSKPIISVQNLSKKYKLGVFNAKTLREEAEALLARFSRRKGDGRSEIGDGAESSNSQLLSPSAQSAEFWALRDVSFDVQPGEVIGIIGKNGAGKSTLLKILSRVTEPTSGEARIRGRVASLLEVGTGFHPELTGRENIFLNGAILGMTKPEIRNKFDEIVAFSGIEKFIDTPVKRYSSGMYVRLAFAVAAHLEPEILIIDEVLAVGDAEFQQKCLGKMRDVAGHGRTVIFVSHNMQAVQRLCDRGILMRGGRVAAEGDTQTVIDEYLRKQGMASQQWERPPDLPTKGFYFESLSVEPCGRQPEMTLAIDAVIKRGAPCKGAFIAFDIVDSSGTSIMQALPRTEPFIEPGTERVGVATTIDLPPLIPGTYGITAWVGSHHTETHDLIESCLKFEIGTSPSPRRTFPHYPTNGYIVPQSEIRIHHGK